MDMKTIVKSLYIILSGALLLSSCSQDDTPGDFPDGTDRRIVFHTSLPGVAARSEEVPADLPYFYMTVFDESDDELVDGDKLKEYINNLHIEKTPGTDKVVSDLCEWPKPGQESDLLHFFAFYPDYKELGPNAALCNATSVSDGGTAVNFQIKDVEVAPNIADGVEFVTACTTGSMANNLFSGIQLGFEHQLCRVEINAWGAHKSCDIEIAGVRIGGVGVHGTFNFNPSESASAWSEMTTGAVEYIYGPDDKIITISRKKELHDTPQKAISLMGVHPNGALLIPADYPAWEIAGGEDNGGMYISVLMRVQDNDKKQQYPYLDTNQGPQALEIPKVYFGVKNGDEILGRLYKKGDSYYGDEACTEPPYTFAAGEDVKEFGWATIPVGGAMERGRIYSYTFDYTSGVGLHGPEVEGDIAPKAGDPIISDKIGISVSVFGWQGLLGSTTHPVVVPAS